MLLPMIGAVVLGYAVLLLVLLRFASEKTLRIVSLVGLIAWLAALTYLTLWIRVPVLEKRIQLVPFAGLQGHGLYEMLQNAVLFLPWGGLLFGLCKRLRPTMCVALGVLMALAVELTQLATGRGICDIDDLLANALGVVLGVLLERLLRRLVKRA